MKNPFLNALCAAVYIAGIILLVNNITKLVPDGAPGDDNIFIPMTMLSLFVLSAAIMGYFFVSKPLRLYMDGSKEESVKFFLKTIGFFAIFMVIYAGIALSLISI